MKVWIACRPNGRVIAVFDSPEAAQRCALNEEIGAFVLDARVRSDSIKGA